MPPRLTPITLILALVVLLSAANNAQQDDGFIRADRLGIAHISSFDTPDERYRQALALGAGWNRWPLYWDRVEPEPGAWVWERYDQQIQRDLAYGLNINAILLGRPESYQDSGDVVQGLYEPIFNDGSDFAASGKSLNPDNPWALFVAQAVNRYRPDGVLAQELGVEGGIRVWEVWNEPDFDLFWPGSARDYARLLKVAYIVIKEIDPAAQVMFGGLLYPTENNWLAQVLSIYTEDEQRTRYNWYMDIVAIHAYANPWRSGWLTLYVRETLEAYDLRKPIWLNETGVPVWNDYPGAVWEASAPNHATQEQQAQYLIQSAVYAWSEGGEKVFFHQLYDDCGDRPAGTDFPPHQGELCTGDRLCFADAHGIFRNQPTSVCFSQHPYPGTPRPVAQAYRLLAEVFGRQSFTDGERVYLDEAMATFTFDRPATDERITVLWNRSFRPVSFRYQAVGDSGQLLSLSGDTILLPENGFYTLELPPATPDNIPDPPANADAAIGGPTYILIEKFGGAVEPALVDLSLPGVEVAAAPSPTLPVAVTATPIPTPDIEDDTSPPLVSIMPLPPESDPAFTVTWTGVDDTGIDRYFIWVRIDGGDWRPWIETPLPSAEYSGVAGSTYEFAAWAVDLAGNWTEDTDIQPQASTIVR